MRGLVLIAIAFLFFAEAAAQEVELQNFETHHPFKRGKVLTIHWTSENSNPVDIELYKGTKWIAGELGQPNSGTYSLMIPPYTDTGKDYRIKITDSKDPGRVMYSDYFRVIPKVPALVKVIPIAMIAVTVILLEGGTKSAGQPNGGGSGQQTTYVRGGN